MTVLCDAGSPRSFGADPAILLCRHAGSPRSFGADPAILLLCAALLAAGCGRVGYSAFDDRDGGGASPIDAAAPTDARAPLDAPSPFDAPPGFDAAPADAPAAPLDSAMPPDSATPPDSGVADTGPGEADGGPPDGGASLDAGPAGAGCGPSAVFCDDFEGATLVPPWGGTIIEPGTTLARTTTMPYAGAGALRATTSADESAAFVYTPIDPSLGGPTVYMRAHLRVDTTAVEHLDLIQLNTGADSIGVIGFSDDLVVYSTLVGAPLGPPTPFPVPRGRYFCLEMGVRFHATDGAIDVWVDGAAVFHGEGLPTFTSTRRVDQARTGASYAGPGQPSVTVHVDEVVVSTARIGCL